jgi:iron complex transport system substrate-binding protein
MSFRGKSGASRVLAQSIRSAVLASVVAAVLCVVAWLCWGPHARGAGHQRSVSLSPAITETLAALGADTELVGVSDYCIFPNRITRLPRVGSGFTPRFESIMALSPTVVFVEAVNATNVEQLARVVHIEAMPWLTLDQVIGSTRMLGKITGHVANAERLAASYEHRLQPRVTPRSPRVLLTMAHAAGELQEVVFIRRNSIHGRVLEAAGAENAVSEAIVGAPRLSLEEVIRRNPDGIVILQSASHADARLIDDWRKLVVLRAVQTNQIKIIAAPEVAIPGPRLLDLTDQIASAVGAWNRAT